LGSGGGLGGTLKCGKKPPDSLWLSGGAYYYFREIKFKGMPEASGKE